jgi:putative nucleotidyltransferase with HDIG domain
MPIPSRTEAARLLSGLAPHASFVAHVSAVAEIAGFLARAVAQQGGTVDRRLVETAALLHDVDKLLPADHGLKPLGHGDAGARWLEERGYGELAPAVAGHPVTRLADDGHYRRWVEDATLEERIVAYADKRAARRLQPMDERFARWRHRHPERAGSLRIARDRAGRLEREVCAAAGIAPSDVRRLRWVGRALAAVG